MVGQKDRWLDRKIDGWMETKMVDREIDGQIGRQIIDRNINSQIDCYLERKQYQKR